MRMAVWVDDIVISSSTAQLRNAFVSALSQRFSVDDQGDLAWVLGVRVRGRVGDSGVLFGGAPGAHTSHASLKRPQIPF